MFPSAAQIQATAPSGPPQPAAEKAPTPPAAMPAQIAKVEPRSLPTEASSSDGAPVAATPQASAGNGQELVQSTEKPVPRASPLAEERLTAQEALALLSSRITAAKKYPEAALRRRTEGAVKVAMSIGADGSLEASKVLVKSGSAVLDHAALDLVQKLFPLPKGLKEAIEVAVTIEYKLAR